MEHYAVRLSSTLCDSSTTIADTKEGNFIYPMLLRGYLLSSLRG